MRQIPDGFSNFTCIEGRLGPSLPLHDFIENRGFGWRPAHATKVFRDEADGRRDFGLAWLSFFLASQPPARWLAAIRLTLAATSLARPSAVARRPGAFDTRRI
jgi:hypothetical protein